MSISLEFQHDMNAGGMLLVSSAVEKCYKAAGSDPAALQPCMLYDAAAFRFDESWRKWMGKRIGHSVPAVPYFAQSEFTTRAARYGPIAFGNLPSAWQRYVVKPSAAVMERVLSSMAGR